MSQNTPQEPQNATERDFPCCEAPRDALSNYDRAQWRIEKIEALTRECLDREATEADVRSRLAVAEAEVERLRCQSCASQREERDRLLAALDAVLARSQAPQAPAEQEGGYPSVPPATADDEGVRRG